MSISLGRDNSVFPYELAHLVETESGKRYYIETFFRESVWAYEVRVSPLYEQSTIVKDQVIYYKRFSVKKDGSFPDAERHHHNLIENLEKYIRE